MSKEIQSFRDLKVWQKAIGLAKDVYVLTRKFPADERFGLTAQVRRAVVSVSSNVAEGHARQGRGFSNFPSISRGSLAEVESQLYLAAELGYLSNQEIANSCDLASELHRMLTALRNSINDRPND